MSREYRRIDTPLKIFPEKSVLKTSEGLGWDEVYAQISLEDAGEILCSGVSDVWFAMPLQPLKIWRKTGLVQERGTLAPDNIVLTGPGCPSHTKLLNRARSLHVFIRKSVFLEMSEKIYGSSAEGLSKMSSAFGLQDRGLNLLLRGIKQTLDDPPELAIIKVKYLARAIAAHCLEYGKVWSQGQDSTTNTIYFSRITDYIERNVERPILLDELAEIFNLGRAELIRLFKVEAGRPPHQYIMIVRLRKACQLLEGTSVSVAEIAQICGFSDQAHMAKLFKRSLRITPSQYRLQTQQRNMPLSSL
ncbi:helix-turn-helix domain-containing protein [Pseudomonas sp. PGPR81]|uniref:helix-turn-helix domain-containing protein n=1 Tax=Pseudomonas sp. PGPR81 TaxID=2913477 RepID=UPI001EDC3DF8|nr:AraC family transcriptional regulator [Pseudomonas sp. PGPR81]